MPKHTVIPPPIKRVGARAGKFRLIKSPFTGTLPGVEDRYLRTDGSAGLQRSAAGEILARHSWAALPEQERIGAVCDFVRDEIPFGYNSSDDLPASAVLADGYGQCNTKTTLLMALLRGSGIGSPPSWSHHRQGNSSDVAGSARFRVRARHHPWAEGVGCGGRWVEPGELISTRLSVQRAGRTPVAQDHSSAMAWAPTTWREPPVRWCGILYNDQATGINEDFGVYDDPDSFCARCHAPPG